MRDFPCYFADAKIREIMNSGEIRGKEGRERTSGESGEQSSDEAD